MAYTPLVQMANLSGMALFGDLFALDHTTNGVGPNAIHIDYCWAHNLEPSFDLSPIILQCISSEHVVLRSNEPLVLKPFISDSGESYQVNVADLGISVAANTRQELFEAIQDLIVVMWQEYALEGDQSLTENARILKQRLLEDFRIEENAS